MYSFHHFDQHQSVAIRKVQKSAKSNIRWHCARRVWSTGIIDAMCWIICSTKTYTECCQSSSWQINHYWTELIDNLQTSVSTRSTVHRLHCLLNAEWIISVSGSVYIKGLGIWERITDLNEIEGHAILCHLMWSMAIWKIQKRCRWHIQIKYIMTLRYFNALVLGLRMNHKIECSVHNVNMWYNDRICLRMM